MGIKIDYDKASSGSVEPGIYEVIVQKAGFRSANNREWFSISFVVRNDCQQKFQNAVIFDTIPQTDRAIAFKVSSIGRAIGIPNGQEFESLEQFGKEIEGTVLQVKVDNEEYNGKTSLRVKEYRKTENKTVNHVFKEKAKTEDKNGFYPINENISDEDLPF